ncbi:alpha/beta fold hydrolase [[Phormidium] sp. ETS-05]|uniref:alpha/beta fold hydrolase n=1 Tax=[Phormidium] sp. ETS-05 TaxID=222819 RepID=UPI0018EED7D7|nr:alpha/beta fold hydrolase [[Phormidium] sp. ETS-05]
MAHSLDALWLNVTPELQGLDRPLLRHLSQQFSIGQWEYHQGQDEPMSIEIALNLLHDYLSQYQHPIHLLGHSTGGLLGLLYARRYPEKVQSLTLLSVGVDPAADWQARYYDELHRISCFRATILTHMVYHLFGLQSLAVAREIRKRLDRALSNSLSPHTLYHRGSFFPGGVLVPLLVCGSENDLIIEPHLLQAWRPWLKENDRLWQCPSGGYFFHYFYPQQLSEQITNFWQQSVAAPIKLTAKKYRDYRCHRG